VRHDEAFSLLSSARASALSDIATLGGELAGIAAATADSNIDDEHDPEGTTVAFERAQLATVLEQAQLRLVQIDEADARLRAGRYGSCERCSAPVGDERLSAIPTARLCMACASR
jgi:DnaK suppressor protein